MLTYRRLRWVLVGGLALLSGIACGRDAANARGETPRATSSSASADADNFFDSAGVRIHYTDEGDGVPVVLIHGFAMNATRWRSAGVTTSLLDSGFRVITIDCRGHGQSEGPHEPGHYGDAMALDVVRLLDHLDLDRSHVVGYSMGAIIANKLRELAPERLQSVTLGGAGWMKKGDPALADLTGNDIADMLEASGDFKGMLRAFTADRVPAASEEEIDTRNQRMVEGNDLVALGAVMRDWDAFAVAEPSLRENAVPALSVVGENDPLKVQVDAMAAVMANLEVVVIEDATHGALTDPAFVESVLQFLAKH